MRLTILDLKRINGQTRHDMNAILRQSIQKSWRGVFALKETNGTQPAANPKSHGPPKRVIFKTGKGEWKERLPDGTEIPIDEKDLPKRARLPDGISAIVTGLTDNMTSGKEAEHGEPNS
jgi:hypothetical protein